MKVWVIIIGSIGCATILYATLIVPYNKAKIPSLSLPVAYGRAMSALGSETNEFHCLDAKITTDFGSDGGWQFTFYSTNSKPKIY